MYTHTHTHTHIAIPGGLGIFLFTTTFRTVLGPTQPPIQWVRGALSLKSDAFHVPLSSLIT